MNLFHLKSTEFKLNWIFHVLYLDPSSSPSLSSSKRIRKAYTSTQMALETEFHCNRFLSNRLEDALILRLSERQIKIWFQKRRMKYKESNWFNGNHRFPLCQSSEYGLLCLQGEGPHYGSPVLRGRPNEVGENYLGNVPEADSLFSFPDCSSANLDYSCVAENPRPSPAWAFQLLSHLHRFNHTSCASGRFSGTCKSYASVRAACHGN